MPIEVPCPNCGATLRAPDSAVGRKARCKKCQHGFRLPGEKADDATGDESTQLSALDAPAFSFDAPANELPGESRSSTSRYSRAGTRSSIAGGRRPAQKNRTTIVLIIVGAVALAGVGIAGFYFSQQPSKPVEKAQASAASAAEPVPPKPAEKPPEKPKEKEPPKKPETKPSTEPKATERKPKTTVTGGLKLPAPPEKAEKLEKFDVRTGVEAEYGKVRKFFVSGGESPVAAVVWASNAGFKGEGGKDSVDRYNLASGTKLDRTEIDATPWPRACDLSPNGELFASESPGGKLTIYDLNAKKKLGNPIAPFVGDDKTAIPALAAALFIDDKSLLVASKNGQLETWNVRTGTRIDSGGVGNITLTAKSIALNGDRSKLVACAGGSLYEVPVKSLVSTAVMPLPHGGEGRAVAVDAGDRVAAIYEATQPGAHQRLLVARLGEAKSSYDNALDASVGTPEAIAWCGAEAFSFSTDAKGAAVVFETEINRPMAVLWPKGGSARHAMANGKHYVLMPDAEDAKKCLLVRVEFPPNDFLPLRNEVEQTNAAVGFLVTPEGFGR